VTFRRVMLVLLPLLGVGFVFAVMWYVYRDWERSLVGRHRPEAHETGRMPAAGVEMETVGPLGHVFSTDVNFIRKDRHGRTELQFLADVVEHLEKETADIERPCIRFFSEQGEVITLLAERGRVRTKGALTDADDIQSGRLWGNVVLVHDGGSPDDYADDILVGLEDVTFDNASQEIATDGPVLMAGGEMTLSASKMRMALDPETRRLDTMTFLEDILITFEAGRRLRVSLTAPAEARGEGEGSTAQTAAGPAPPTSMGAPGVPGAPADAVDREGSPDADEAGDLWRIDLAGDVHARQGAQRLRCEHLTLYNRSRGAMPGGSAPPAVPAGEAGPPAPAEEPGAAAPAGVAASPSAPPPASADEEAPPAPLMTVVADGPLIITPVGPDERRSLGDEQYRVSATGRPAVVEDGDTRITGGTVRYNTRTGSGTVIGQDSPMRLEQPGRLLLTGGRLDFDRAAATAEVTGEGRLRARVRTAGLTGATPSAAGEGPDTSPASSVETASSADAADADAATPEADRLEATWHKGLRLAFYRLPEDAGRGLGEIRRARFRGQAVVKQAKGLLKGDDLTIDFYPAEDDRGQALRRLLGHGDVLLKNAPVGGTEPDEAAQMGDIAAEDLDIRFARNPDGGARPTHLDASGDVAINDPKGRIRAQDLAVAFGVSDEGETEARFLEARGEVLIDREDLRAEGDHVRRDTAAGTLLLEGRPARARRGDSRIVGPHIRFSRADGRATVTGAGELEVPATTDLRGRPRARPEPLLVTWHRDMHFSDRRNFARFDGEVTAGTGGTDLECRRLWVHFADAPADAEPSTAGGAAGGAASEDTSGEAAETADENAAADEGLQNLFGRKRLVRVLAEKDVIAVDQRLEEGRAIRHRMEITGDNLTYLEKSRKAYMHGPGRLRILARERAGSQEASATSLTPEAAHDAWRGKAPRGYARTQVAWADSMAFDGLGNQAYFQGDTEAVHTGRGVPGEAGGRRREPTTTRIRSTDLQVVFGERPGPAAPPTPREERMRVEKLIARGDVLLWIDDRRGAGERLIYQRRPELVRLYRGPEPGEWARLWRQNEATQEFGQIAARTITYDPGTGRVDVVDQQVITLSPAPTPQPKQPPRLVPGPIE